MPRWDEAIEDVLASYDRSTLIRGRQYADDGRVTVTRRDVLVVHGRVRGTQPYDVRVGVDGDSLFASCTCPAYDREGACKHIAALAYAVRGNRPEPATTLPGVFRAVYSASSVLARLALYSGARESGPEPDRWLSLADWFWRSKEKSNLTAYTADIESVLERLRTWLPPSPADIPTTGYEILYAQLCELYAERAEDCEIRHALPGPLDERHPGWTFTFDAKRRVLEARERSSPLYDRPLRLAVSVAIAPGTPLRFEGQAFASYAGADAWEVFALRALLDAMHARRDDAIRALEQELARPLWEHVLDDLVPKPLRAEDAREWSFAVVPTYHDYSFSVSAFVRPTGGRATKWKKQPFESLFASDRPDEAAEREIARIALCSVESRQDAMLTLGSPQGHELARLLAAHPRVVFPRQRGAIDGAASVRFIVGALRLHLERAPNGSLTPQFFVGETELPFPPAMLVGAGATAMFRGAAEVDREAGTVAICSVQVPVALRAWLEAIARMGGNLAFPVEAVPKVASATQSLVNAGVVSLPREALGEELTPEPRGALRVEWKSEEARLECLASVHPKAPLVEPGIGPKLFTFQIDDRRVFVERTFKDELAIANGLQDSVDADVGWTPTGGVVEGVPAMIELAAWLDANPLGLRIEVKKGTTPTVTAWENASTNLKVNKRGGWLNLDGDIDVNGAKLTVGDVLEAVRHARRYVAAGEGTFLELSKEVIEKLQPVAMAAELAANDNAGPGAVLHDAFGLLLHEALDVFSSVDARQVDLDVYVKRFSARSKATRVPALEKGTLRPYQKDGVEWMLQLAAWAPGCVLADDMGLGKTVQTASVLKARAKLGPALIVAPASVSSNWVAELARFMPSLDVHWFNAKRDLVDLGAGDVLVVSYGLLQREKELFAATEWSTVVVDEAQYVKNSGAARSDAVRALPRAFTIALTGTPLENHLGELFSIVDLAFPGLLGDAETFRERFRKPIEAHKNPERLAALSRLLAPFLLRRTRAAVLRDLPAREEITEQLDLSPPERKRYLALRKACEDQFQKRRSKKDETPAQLRIALLAALTRLRQLACDPALVDPTYDGPSTKIGRVVELTTELAAEGNKALVFSGFTTFLAKVRDALVAAGLKVGYLAGDTPTTKRKALVDAFQAGEYDVFCVSLLAGGTGLNLTRASYVVHLDPWWNPAAEEQATSRAHRMGQTGPVTVYRLVARGTIEEAVLEMHGQKRDLAAAVLDGKGEAKAVSEHELLELLRFGN